MAAKCFCLLSTGRAGSTALMRAIGRHPDIATPPANAELLNPRLRIQFTDYVKRLGGDPTDDSAEALLEAFLRLHSSASYIGFKLLPLQLRSFERLVRDPGIQFIVLTRRDLVSHVASWFVARRYDTFRVGTQSVVKQITFGTEWRDDLRRHIRMIQKNVAAMAQVKDAIRLEYEDLCAPGFSCAALNDYFGRSIALESPHPPTDARHYVQDWEHFAEFVHHEAALTGAPHMTT